VIAPPDVECRPMAAATRDDARRLLAAFLDGDEHYRASAAQYGDGGSGALERALDLFLAHPGIGFVWLAFASGRAKAACVVCYAISTSRGALVAKLDDVTVDRASLGEGIGTHMLEALARHLAARGIGRIDSACHRDTERAWRFSARLGFRPLYEERLARIL
jgi:GNAT superfamily N-acetyltransferase